MKRIIGFIMFWIAVGMTIMMFIDSALLSICLILFVWFWVIISSAANK